MKCTERSISSLKGGSESEEVTEYKHFVDSIEEHLHELVLGEIMKDLHRTELIDATNSEDSTIEMNAIQECLSVSHC